jgi:hypothetical protein
MTMSEDLKEITAIIASLAALVGAIFGLIVYLRKLIRILKRYLRKEGNIVVPLLKFFAASATLLIPNGIWIWLVMYWMAVYYREAGGVDFITTDQVVFTLLIVSQAGSVSIYSYLWSILLYPRIRRWFISGKPEAQQQTLNINKDQSAQPSQNQASTGGDQSASSIQLLDDNLSQDIQPSNKKGAT